VYVTPSCDISNALLKPAVVCDILAARSTLGDSS
jgi:hypothetical protein